MLLRLQSPGTCSKVVKPVIEEELTKRNLTLNNYRLGHSYERVMPGPQYIDSIREFPLVYSGINDASAGAVGAIFTHHYRYDQVWTHEILAHTNATEMAKVLENPFRAMNIAFVVEWSRFAEEEASICMQWLMLSERGPRIKI